MRVKKTFIVDDDFIFRTASEILVKVEKLTREVETYENGLLALEKLKELVEENPKDLPELLFLDINMPVMTGWEFLEALKDCDNTIKEKVNIYVVTSSIAPEDLNLSKQYDFLKGYINKPLSISDIRNLKKV